MEYNAEEVQARRFKEIAKFLSECHISELTNNAHIKEINENYKSYSEERAIKQIRWINKYINDNWR